LFDFLDPVLDDDVPAAAVTGNGGLEVKQVAVEM